MIAVCIGRSSMVLVENMQKMEAIFEKCTRKVSKKSMNQSELEDTCNPYVIHDSGLNTPIHLASLRDGKSRYETILKVRNAVRDVTDLRMTKTRTMSFFAPYQAR